MFETIFIYIFLILISFFPIVIWAYIFSYVDNNPLNKKRFLVWVIGWALSVLPILYMDKIIALFDISYLNTFYYISQVKWFLSSMEFGVSLSIFLFLIILFSFILWAFVHKFDKIIKVYLKNIMVFLVFIILLSLFVFVLNYILPSISIQEEIVFWDIVFNSLKLVIFYYLVVAFIEESSKHFNFLQSSILHINSVKTGVLYAIFVALGFSLIENILYIYNYYLVNWLSWDLVKLSFYRSIFSVIVHVLSSSVVAYYFSRALLLYREKDLSFPYLKIFSFWLLVSIWLHLFFDVALTLWFTFIMFLYFVWGYLYVSSIFYKE